MWFETMFCNSLFSVMWIISSVGITCDYGNIWKICGKMLYTHIFVYAPKYFITWGKLKVDCAKNG